MSVELILAKETDKSFLLELRKLTMVEHFEKAGLYLSDEEHAFRLNDLFECSYLIVDSGEQAGTLKYRELSDVIEVIQIQVHPKNQGKGLGKTVMEKVIGWSKQKHKKIALTVLKDNPAKLFYQRLGFKITGEDEYEFHMERHYFPRK